MLRRSGQMVLALVVAVMVTSPVAVTTSGAPGSVDDGTVLNTKQSKAEAKAEAEATKDAAKVEKERAKCAARGNWPCLPAITLTWIPGPIDEACWGVISVVGFQPGFIAVGIQGYGGEFFVGKDGTGSIVTSEESRGPQSAVHFVKGETHVAGASSGADIILSEPSTVAC